MRMMVFDIEGTVEEIRETVQFMRKRPTGSHAIVVEPNGKAQSEEVVQQTFIDEEFARRVLTRRPLSKEVKAVLKTVRDANPEPVRYEDLGKAAGYSRQQLAGLFGAFGRRIAHTAGYDANARFWDIQEDAETGRLEYSLPDSVIQALDVVDFEEE